MKIALLVLVCVIASGCAGPRMHNTFFSGAREGVYGYQGKKLHFVIVSDGRLAEAKNGSSPLRGDFWEGKIQPADPARPAIRFDCGQSTINIGNETYRLRNGRVFTVSTKTPATVIRQFDISPAEDMKNIIESDTRFEFPTRE